MTYRAGIGTRIAEELGLAHRTDAHVRCDAIGCDATASAYTLKGDLARWAMRQRAPRGWHLTRTELEHGAVHRIDLCPKHRKDRKP